MVALPLVACESSLGQDATQGLDHEPTIRLGEVGPEEVQPGGVRPAHREWRRGGLRDQGCVAWNPSLTRRTARFDPIRKPKQCGEGYCNGDRIGVRG